MKIFLVDPPFEIQDSASGNPSLKWVLNVVPSMGLGYLAAVAERAGHEVRVVDGTLGLSDRELDRLVSDFSPDVVGFTSTTPAFRGARRLAKRVRELFPGRLIVLGGAHVSALPEEALASGCFDVGVVGEGEHTFSELLESYGRDRDFDRRKIRGIVYREDGVVKRTSPRPLMDDLDDLPFPARHLFPPLSKYSPTPASYRRLPVGIVMTSRGCPSRCAFCDRSVFGETYRRRSPENVVAEVEALLRDFGAREIRFFDDTFTLSPHWIRRFISLLKERRLQFPWTCLSKVRGVSRELFEGMKEGGCWQVLFGLESGDPEMLRLLGKGNTVEDNGAAVRAAHEAGLSVRGDFVIGAPGDSLEKMERTFRHAVDLKLEYAHFNKFVPYPGTELFRQMRAAGKPVDFDAGSSSILDHDAIFHVPAGLDRESYRKWLNGVYGRYYLRPSYLFRRAVALRSWDEFLGQVRGGVSILGLGVSRKMRSASLGNR
ncbi:MAG TPA: radical SAM protein [Elusimicrobiota bacterium]|nr:radical SAM protein [Elusimicrobiota bacterium]